MVGLGETRANLDLAVSDCRHLSTEVGENFDFTYLGAIQSKGVVPCSIYLHVLGLLTAESQTKVPWFFGHVIRLFLHILVVGETKAMLSAKSRY